jgi:hypothetical protein
MLQSSVTQALVLIFVTFALQVVVRVLMETVAKMKRAYTLVDLKRFVLTLM